MATIIKKKEPITLENWGGVIDYNSSPNQKDINSLQTAVDKDPIVSDGRTYTEVRDAIRIPEISNSAKQSISSKLTTEMARAVQKNKDLTPAEQQARLMEASRRSGVPMGQLYHRPDLVDQFMSFDGSEDSQTKVAEHIMATVGKETELYNKLNNDPRNPVLALSLDSFVEQDARVKQTVTNKDTLVGQSVLRFREGYQNIEASLASKNLMEVRANPNASQNEIWLAEQRRDRQQDLLNQLVAGRAEDVNIVEQAIYGTAGLAPIVLESAKRQAVIGTLTGGTSGIVGVGAALARTLASAGFMYAVETGGQYQAIEEQRAEGLVLDEDIARRSATAYGVLSAALEQVQIGGIIGRIPIGKSVIGNGISKLGRVGVARSLGHFAGNLLEEAAVETTQELTGMGLMDLAVGIQNRRDGEGQELPYNSSDFVQAGFDTMYNTMVDMSIMVGVPSVGHALNARRVSVNRNKQRVSNGLVHRDLLTTNIEYAGKQQITNLMPIDAGQIFDQVGETHGATYEAFVSAQSILDSLGDRSEGQADFFLKNTFNTSLAEVRDSAAQGSDLATTIGSLAVLANQDSTLYQSIQGDIKDAPDGLTYAELDNQARRSKVSQRVSAEVSRIETMRQVAPADSVTIPSEQYERLFQRNPDQMAEALGITPEQAAAALDTNEDLLVNIRDIQNPDVLQAAQDIVTGLNYQEARAAIEQELAGNVELQRQATTEMNQMQAHMDDIRRADVLYENQLRSVGLGETVARRTANVLTSYIERRANDLGIGFNEYRDIYADIGFTKSDVEGTRGNILLPQGDSTARVNITIGRNADASTALHELAHFFLFDTRRLANMIVDNTAFADQLSAISEFIGEDITGDIISEAAQERFADGFVEYLREGRLAERTSQLQPAFRAFKRWLGSVYGANAVDGVEMTDNARQAFESMLLVEEELSTLKEFYGIDGEAETAGIESADDILRNLARRETVILENAANLALADTIVDQIQNRAIEQTAEYKAAFARELERLGTIEPGNSDGYYYGALGIMKRDPNARLSSFDLIASFGSEIIDSLPNWTWSANSVIKVEDMANHVGAPSSLAFIQRLAADNDIRETARNNVLANMQNPDTTASIISTLEDKFNSDSALQPLLQMKKEIEEALRPEEQEAARIRNNVIKAQLRSAAIEATLNIDTSKLSTKLSAAIATKARNTIFAKDAVRVGNREAASEYLNRALMAGQMAIELRRAHNRVRILNNKLSKAVATVRKTKITDGAAKLKYLAQAESILRKYGKLENIYRPTDQSLAQFVAEVQSQGHILLIPEWLTEGENAGNISRGLITFGQLTDLSNTVSAILKLGNDEAKLSREFYKYNLAETIGELAQQTDRTWSDVLERSLEENLEGLAAGEVVPESRTIPRLVSDFLRYTQIFKTMDGLNVEDGLWTRYFTRPLEEAIQRKAELGNRYLSGFEQQYNAMYGDMTPAEQRAYTKTKNIMIGDRVYSRQEVVAMALNNGTIVNQERLMTSEGLNIEQVNYAMSLLTSKEWDFVEAYWNTASAAFKDVITQENTLTGNVIRAKAPNAFTAVEADTGRTRSLTGGYAPILNLFNTRQDIIQALSGEATEQTRTASSLLPDLFARGNNFYATTDHGFTKAAARTTGLKIDLSLGKMINHFEQVSHDLAYRGTIRDIQKLLMTGAINGRLRAVLGSDVIGAIHDSLRYIASGSDAQNLTQAETALGKLSGRVASSLITLNPLSALKQPLGFFSAAREIGVMSLIRAIPATMGFGSSTVEQINTKQSIMEASAYMADRLSLKNDADLTSLSRSFAERTALADGRTRWNQYGGLMMRAMDGYVSQAVWRGFFDKAVNEVGLTGRDAIAYADRGVQNTQDTSGVITKVRAQQKGGLLNTALTMFQSSMISNFNSFWGLYQAGFQSDLSKGELFGAYASTFLYNYWGYSTMARFITGDRPDDEQGWAEWLLAPFTDPALAASVLIDQLPGGSLIGQGAQAELTPVAFRPFSSLGTAALEINKSFFDSDRETDWFKVTSGLSEFATGFLGYGGGAIIRRGVRAAGDIERGKREADWSLFFRLLGVSK